MKDHDETEHLLSTEANKERLLEDVFNDEKRQGVKELIDAHKQTLEEASWKYNPLKKLDGEFLRHAFKDGAKWQQERSYSEEEVVQLLDALWNELDIWYNKEDDEQFNLIRWFFDSGLYKERKI